MAATSEAPTSGSDRDTRSAKARPGPGRARTGATRSGFADRAAASSAAAARALARIVRLAAWIVAAIIVAGILLVVLKANQSNGIVNAVHDAAHWLASPFAGMFSLHNPRLGVAVNWGIAALVYVIAGALVARLITLIGGIGLRRRGAARA